MSDPVALAMPRIEVKLDDGRTEVATILNVDLLRWDRTAAKHGWPDFSTVGVWHSTFLCWAALRRTGQIPEAWTWEEFSDVHCLQLSPVESNGTEPDEAHPTRPEAELG